MIWTGEAERDAKSIHGKEKKIPWANIKFSKAWNGTHKLDLWDSSRFVKLAEHGVPCIGEFVGPSEAVKYKYHIDLGGNGGKQTSTYLFGFFGHSC